MPILLLQNNATVTMPVNIFTNNPALSANINAPLYQWTITGQSFVQLTNVQVEVQAPGVAGFTTLTAPVSSSDTSGIVNALNSLNIGTFYASVDGAGNIFINSNSSFYVYRNLIVNQQPQNANWITTGQLATSSLSITSMGMTFSDNRSSTFLGGTGSSGVPPIPPAITNINTTFPFSSLANGDVIAVTVTAAPIAAYTFHLILKQNGIQILDQTNSNAGGFYIFNFIYSLNATYDFNATVN